MNHTLLVFPRFKYPSGDPPLGVAYLAACIREAGHPVSIFDATFEPSAQEALASLLRERDYGLVAISALTSMLTDTAAAARLVKEVSPDTTVIVGGPHATIDPAGTARIEGVDAAHIGQGERSLPALVSGGLDFRNTRGFAHYVGDEYVDNGPAEGPGDLDAIPYPAWDLLPMDRYLDIWYQLDAVSEGLRGTSIIASRGCPFDCAYCQPTLRTIFGAKIRRRSPENLVGELSELKGQFGIDGVMWLDDTFLLDRDWTQQLCLAMIEAKLELMWGCNVRADVVDRPSLEIMKEAGLRVMHVGIESATQRILDDVYQKGITVEQAVAAVHLARSVGLDVRGYFMLGAPGETEEEIRATIDLATSLPLSDATFSIVTPLPHTHLWEKTRRHIARDVTDFDYYKVPVYRSGAAVSPRRLVWLKRMAFLRFYLGPRRLLRTVRSFLSQAGIRKALVKSKRF